MTEAQRQRNKARKRTGPDPRSRNPIKAALKTEAAVKAEPADVKTYEEDEIEKIVRDASPDSLRQWAVESFMDEFKQRVRDATPDSIRQWAIEGRLLDKAV